MSTEIRSNRPVFFDGRGRRKKGLGVAGIVFGLAATLLISVFLISVLINPFLPKIRLKPIAALPQQSDTKLNVPELPPLSKTEALLRQSRDKLNTERERRNELHYQKAARSEMLLADTAPVPTAPPAGKPVAVGF